MHATCDPFLRITSFIRPGFPDWNPCSGCYNLSTSTCLNVSINLDYQWTTCFRFYWMCWMYFNSSCSFELNNNYYSNYLCQREFKTYDEKSVSNLLSRKLNQKIYPAHFRGTRYFVDLKLRSDIRAVIVSQPTPSSEHIERHVHRSLLKLMISFFAQDFLNIFFCWYHIFKCSSWT